MAINHESPTNARSKDKWCKFHKYHGHDPEDSIQLKREIKELLELGNLKEYVKISEPRRERKGENYGKNACAVWTPRRKGQKE